MNGRERILAHLAGRPVDRLPFMPITMMFAARQAKARYLDYCTDYRVLADAQVRTAETFGFDFVSTISDPAREAADCGARVQYFPEQPPSFIEEEARLAEKIQLAGLRQPDPLGGGQGWGTIGHRAAPMITRRAEVAAGPVELSESGRAERSSEHGQHRDFVYVFHTIVLYLCFYFLAWPRLSSERSVRLKSRYLGC